MQIEKIGKKGLIALLASINLWGGAIFGFNVGVIAGALDPICNYYGFDPTSNKTATLKGALSGSLIAGATIGALISGPIADRIGRKPTIIGLSCITVIGALLSAASPWFISLCIIRGLLGIGVGLTAVVCPLFVSEVAPDRLRGTLGTLFQLAITFFIFIAYIINFALADVSSKYNWRVMFGLAAIPSAILLAISIIMPESPVWSQKRKDKLVARDYMQQPEAEGDNYSNGINSTLTTEKRGIAWKSSIRPMLLGFLLCVILQLTGVNAIISFAPDIFKKAGFGGSTGPLLATMGVGFWNFVTTFVSVFFVDRSGRRPLYILGLTLMTISNITLGFTMQLVHDTRVLGIIAVICVLLFIAGFETGPGPLFYVITMEMYPAHIRDVGSALASAIQWFFNLIILVGFLPLVEAIGQAAVYFIFGGIALVTWFLILMFLPETKNKAVGADNEGKALLG